MRVVKLYGCAIVFAVWAVVRVLGFHGDVVVAAFLLVAAIAFVVAERERSRLRRESRQRPPRPVGGRRG